MNHTKKELIRDVLTDALQRATDHGERGAAYEVTASMYEKAVKTALNMLDEERSLPAEVCIATMMDAVGIAETFLRGGLHTSADIELRTAANSVLNTLDATKGEEALQREQADFDALFPDRAIAPNPVLKTEDPVTGDTHVHSNARAELTFPVEGHRLLTEPETGAFDFDLQHEARLRGLIRDEMLSVLRGVLNRARPHAVNHVLNPVCKELRRRGAGAEQESAEQGTPEEGGWLLWDSALSLYVTLGRGTPDYRKARGFTYAQATGIARDSGRELVVVASDGWVPTTWLKEIPPGHMVLEIKLDGGTKAERSPVMINNILNWDQVRAFRPFVTGTN